MPGLRSTLAAPARAFLDSYQLILERGVGTIAATAAGMAASWWIYVPIHELLHVAGCLLAGGTVQELEIAPLYGGEILSSLFSFVTAGGEYAGRLSGFDTGGSDLVYAVTIAFPFLLTLPAFAWMKAAAVRRRGFLFGASLPPLFAPLISLTGDFLELGSLLLFQFWPGRGGQHRALVSDDLFRLVDELRMGQYAPLDAWQSAPFILSSLMLSAMLAWLIVWIALLLSRSFTSKSLRK